jgi:DNA-directed RNA polymerase specialized sigma24 family protein
VTACKRSRSFPKLIYVEVDTENGQGPLIGAAKPWAPNPEELYRESELRDILIKALEELRPILGTIFLLRDIEGSQ